MTHSKAGIPFFGNVSHILWFLFASLEIEK